MTDGEYSHWKPLDFGADGITGSVDHAGRIIALNCYDPVYGYITLTSGEPFPDEDRYDPAKVRAFRAALPKLQGFGVTFDSPVERRVSSLAYDVLPDTFIHFAGGAAVPILTFPVRNGAAQIIFFGEFAGDVSAGWRGRLSLQRCAYTQLTEGGVMSAPPLVNQVVVRGDAVTITHPGLGRAVAIIGLGSSEAQQFEADAPFALDLALPQGEGSVLVVYQFADTPDAALAAATEIYFSFDSQSEPAIEARRKRFPESFPDPLARRGLIYGALLCVPVGEALCILTDHMLLPLSWNRDAYYVALALLHGAADGPDLMRRHLRWMFDVAERPDGDWARCYLANGRIKDKAYQLDQQLYPLLELADYTKLTGDTRLLTELQPQVAAVLDALERHRDAALPLYATDETPGDDPIALPYHLSSHILLWRALTALADVLNDAALAARADDMRAAVQAHFVTAGPDGRRLYAYATDGRGSHHLYHDANDLPLALAPAWGFCTAGDPVWRATVDFAFSPANPGFYNGRLGSVHTPAPWALGDLQDVVAARALNDAGREEAAWSRLRRGAAIDGALPEAYDADTGAVVSRTWFAWPNAAAACIALGVWG